MNAISGQALADRRISIVVPIYNRTGHVDALLRSLTWSLLDSGDFEVVVCDDGGTEPLSDVVEHWREEGIDITLVSVRPPGATPRNNAAARNAGLQAARYPIVLNTDSDVVFATDVLVQMRSATRPGRFCSCAEFYELTEEATNQLTALGREGVLGAEDYLKRAVGRPNQVDAPDGVRALHGAFACWRSALVEMGGYDESYELWGWEDRDLLTRLESGLGLSRAFVQGTVVVHRWHPMLRGDDRRDELARRGVVSSLALRRQLQKTRSQKFTSIVCNAPHEPPTIPAWSAPEFETAWCRDTDPDDFMAACTEEAGTLRRAGHANLARKLLLFVLSRPWDSAKSLAPWPTWEPIEPTSALAPSLAQYRSSAAAIAELARCDRELRHVGDADIALATLEAWPGGQALAWWIRAKQHLQGGRAVDARTSIDKAVCIDPRPAYVALAVELALQADESRRAYELVTGALGSRTPSLDHFEELLFHAYLEILAIMNSPRWSIPDALVLQHERVKADISEHVYSVGIRALREGLDLAADCLLARFLAGGAPAEPRLYSEGAAMLSHIRTRLSRRTDQVR